MPRVKYSTLREKVEARKEQLSTNRKRQALRTKFIAFLTRYPEYTNDFDQWQESMANTIALQKVLEDALYLHGFVHSVRQEKKASIVGNKLQDELHSSVTDEELESTLMSMPLHELEAVRHDLCPNVDLYHKVLGIRRKQEKEASAFDINKLRHHDGEQENKQQEVQEVDNSTYEKAGSLPIFAKLREQARLERLSEEEEIEKRNEQGE